MRSILPACIALVMPMSAHAQLKVNDLYGQNLAAVNKLLGKPVEVDGTPINYAHYKNPNFISAQVWFNFRSGIVAKAQFATLAKPGETTDSVLKRYGLSVGANPKNNQVVKPAISMVNSAPVPGMPWTRVFISYMYAMPFKEDLVKYCKDRHLDPNKTWFWTIQVLARNPQPRMMGAGDTGAGKPKGKKKGGH